MLTKTAPLTRTIGSLLLLRRRDSGSSGSKIIPAFTLFSKRLNRQIVLRPLIGRIWS
jgi:hypothetical protein